MRTTQYTRNRGVIVERCAAKREDLGSPQGSCICTLHDVVFFPGRIAIVARAHKFTSRGLRYFVEILKRAVIKKVYWLVISDYNVCSFLSSRFVFNSKIYYEY